MLYMCHSASVFTNSTLSSTLQSGYRATHSGMMAPVFGLATAGCSFPRSATLLFLTALLSFFISDVLPALVCDRLTLLSIRSSMVDLDISSSHNGFIPPSVASVWIFDSTLLDPRKSQRRRGERAGVQLKFRLLFRRGLAGKRRRGFLVTCAQTACSEENLSSLSLLDFARPGLTRSCYLRSGHPGFPVIYYDRHGSNSQILRPLKRVSVSICLTYSRLSMVLLNA